MFIYGPIPVVTSIILLLARVSMGLLFLLAGIRKIWPVAGVPTDEQGETASQAGNMAFSDAMQEGVQELIGVMGERLGAFAAMVVDIAPEWLPEEFARFYGLALPWVEIGLGVLLLLGLLTRLAAAIGTLVLVSILVAVGFNWWPPEGLPFAPVVVFIPLALLLVSLGGGAIGIDRLLFRKRG